MTTAAVPFRCPSAVCRRLLLICCALLCRGGLAWGQPAQLPLVGGGPVLVLAFEPENRADGAGWLREGLPLLVAGALEAQGADVFDRATRIEALEQLQLPPQSPLSRASAIRVGELLGAAAVVTGQFSLSGTSLVIRARTVSLSPPALSPEVTLTRPLGALFEAASGVASLLAGAPSLVGAWVTPPSVAAFAALVEGLTADSVDEQERYLKTALNLAPAYAEARLAYWSLLRDEGRHGPALEAVMAVPQASGLQRQARYAAALSLIDLRRHDEAFRTLRDLLKLQPASAVANALGVIQLRRTPTAQTGQPTYYFSQAVELDPENADLYFNLGYAYWRARDAQGSAYWLREAVRRNPADAEAHFVLGSALQQLGATVEGQREQALARQLSGDVDRWSTGVPSGLERLSTTLKGVRRRGHALDAPTSAAERTSLARFHLDAGRRAFERGDDREALSALRRATFLSPYLAEAHLLLGRLYLRADRVDEAVAALRIALWSDDSPDAKTWLAEALARQRPTP